MKDRQIQMDSDKRNFEKIVSAQYNERQFKKDLNSARIVCEQLDIENVYNIYLF